MDQTFSQSQLVSSGYIGYNLPGPAQGYYQPGCSSAQYNSTHGQHLSGQVPWCSQMHKSNYNQYFNDICLSQQLHPQFLTASRPTVPLTVNADPTHLMITVTDQHQLTKLHAQPTRLLPRNLLPPVRLSRLYFGNKLTAQLHPKFPARKPPASTPATAPDNVFLPRTNLFNCRARSTGRYEWRAPAPAVLGPRMQWTRVLDVQQPFATPEREVRRRCQGGMSGLRGGVYAVDGEEYSCRAGEVQGSDWN